MGSIGSPGSQPGTVEAWALEFILTVSLAHKFAPPDAPATFEAASVDRLVDAPGRPPQLRLARRRSAVPDKLDAPSARAKLLHTFLHHELQAAELMCWALLRFSSAEEQFRRGLMRICLDEIRHMNAYRVEIERLGFQYGDFPVRDWFWERVPTCASKIEFVALMGIGLEGANLEHAPHFAERLEQAGDSRAAELQRLIAREELGHVSFAVHWFERWTRPLDFAVWCAALPAPLSPLMMKGKNFDRQARLRAGMSESFITQLERWQP